MSLKTVKRIAAEIAGVGKSRVKILDPARASEALTREDVRGLMQQKAIVIVQAKGVGRGKARLRKKRERMGRGRGVASRHGTMFARMPRKERWARQVRALRRVLQAQKKRLRKGSYQQVYAMIKGNAFKDKKHFMAFLQEKKLLK